MPNPVSVQRIIAPLRRALEGAVRPGPYPLPITGGWLPDGAPWNWWQSGSARPSFPKSAIVESCISRLCEHDRDVPRRPLARA